MMAVREDFERNQKEPGFAEVKEDIYSIEEIRIEEMAFDGICGVY